MSDADAVNLALLAFRCAVGAVFLAHGYNHLFRGGKVAGTARWFESLGMRPGKLHALLASWTEIGGRGGAGGAEGEDSEAEAADFRKVGRHLWPLARVGECRRLVPAPQLVELRSRHQLRGDRRDGFVGDEDRLPRVVVACDYPSNVHVPDYASGGGHRTRRFSPSLSASHRRSKSRNVSTTRSM